MAADISINDGYQNRGVMLWAVVAGTDPMEFVRVSADATGAILISGANPMSIALFVASQAEDPIGDGDGVTTVFTTAVPYVATTLKVWINGNKILRTTNYSETDPAAGTFTMVVAPTDQMTIYAEYFKA